MVKTNQFKNAVSVLELLKNNNVESVEMVSVQLNGNFVDKNDFDKNFFERK